MDGVLLVIGLVIVAAGWIVIHYAERARRAEHELGLLRFDERQRKLDQAMMESGKPPADSRRSA